MKIQTPKSAPAEKPTVRQESPKNNNDVPTIKTDFQTLFNPAGKVKMPETQAKFAKILEESRNENANRKKTESERKTEDSRENSASDEVKKDEETADALHEKDSVDEGNEQSGGEENSDEQDEASTFVPMNFYAQTKPVSETSVPSARAILHVVDLERIVSMVRTQNLKNAEQVIISLKHSVLEGLQIKLAIDENSNLKVEFLAVNEHIKNHLNTRKEELKHILRERGIKLSDLNVRQGSDFQSSEIQPQKETAKAANSNGESDLEITDAIDSDNQTSYRV